MIVCMQCVCGWYLAPRGESPCTFDTVPNGVITGLLQNHGILLQKMNHWPQWQLQRNGKYMFLFLTTSHQHVCMDAMLTMRYQLLNIPQWSQCSQIQIISLTSSIHQQTLLVSWDKVTLQISKTKSLVQSTVFRYILRTCH